METKITIKDNEIKSLFNGMSAADKKRALEDSGTLIIASTHAGFLSETGPDNQKWEENTGWYFEAKGQAAILTGPTSKTIRGGEYAGRYEFKSINNKRMRNSLLTRISGNAAYVEYEKDVEERAELTQYGGESKMILKSTTGKKDLEIDMTVPARPHLGVAENYARFGGKTDDKHIEDIFSKLVDKVIK